MYCAGPPNILLTAWPIYPIYRIMSVPMYQCSVQQMMGDIAITKVSEDGWLAQAQGMHNSHPACQLLRKRERWVGGTKNHEIQVWEKSVAYRAVVSPHIFTPKRNKHIVLRAAVCTSHACSWCTHSSYERCYRLLQRETAPGVTLYSLRLGMIACSIHIRYCNLVPPGKISDACSNFSLTFIKKA